MPRTNVDSSRVKLWTVVSWQPCIVTDNTGRGVPMPYTRVIMGPDPHVIGIIPRDRSQYGGPQYAMPDHNQGECPRYTQDDLWRFKYSADKGDTSITRWSTSMTSHLLPRLHGSARCLASSSCTRKRSARLKNTCGRLVNSRMQAHAG